MAIAKFTLKIKIQMIKIKNGKNIYNTNLSAKSYVLFLLLTYLSFYPVFEI